MGNGCYITESDAHFQISYSTPLLFCIVHSMFGNHYKQLIALSYCVTELLATDVSMLLWRETQEGISNSTTEAINQGITLSVCFNMAPIASIACGKRGELKQAIVDLKNR